MGIFRLLLASCVFLAHTGSFFGFVFLGGPTAVQSFYVLSGFSMELVFRTKYDHPGGFGIFLRNRFLRIFPTYWLALAASVCFSIVSLLSLQNPLLLSSYVRYWESLGIFPLLFLFCTNIFIIGQDAAMFLRFSPTMQSLVPTRNFWKTDPPVHSFLLIPQAWTVALEILFYSIAPFLYKQRTATLIILAIASLLAKQYLYSMGLDHDPWTYRLFPLEIGFFIVGMIAHRLFRDSIDRIRLDRSPIPIGILLCTVLCYQYIPLAADTKKIFYFFVLFCSLPFLLRYSVHAFDQLCARLSYPFFILHYLVLQIWSTLTGRVYPYDSKSILVVWILTVALSYLVLLLLRPIERIRIQNTKMLAFLHHDK